MTTLSGILPPKFDVCRVTDRQWLGVLLVLGILTHFAWPLSEPRAVLLDERDYGQEVASYITHKVSPFMEGTHVVDIHPPHAKIMTAIVARFLGYQEEFTHKEGDYAPDFPLFAIRFFPALCGILIPILFFCLARKAGSRGLEAPLAGIGLGLDNALVVHTRIISTDGLLVVSSLAALWCYLNSRQKRPLLGAGLSGVFSGLALGTKFTGLAVGGFLGLVYLFREKSLKKFLVFFAAGSVIYLVGWWLHFHLLGIQADFWPEVLSQHSEMFSFNQKVGREHSSSSHWWTWPLGGRPIWIGGKTLHYPDLNLTEIGNLFFWWGTFILFLFSLKQGALQKDRELAWWSLAYLISFLPFAVIGRYMFLYHYFSPLSLSLLVVVIARSGKLNAARFWDVAVILLLVFVLSSPLTYSYPGFRLIRISLYDYLPNFW